MDDTAIKKMPVSAFRSVGYLHEVNRLLLHPLGLAMEINLATEPMRVVRLKERGCVVLEQLCRESLAGQGPFRGDDAADLLDALGAERMEAGDETLGGIWDYSDDPEGMTYGEDLLSPLKAVRVAQELLQRRKLRMELLGYVIQPVDTQEPTLTVTYIDPAERSAMPPAFQTE